MNDVLSLADRVATHHPHDNDDDRIVFGHFLAGKDPFDPARLAIFGLRQRVPIIVPCRRFHAEHQGHTVPVVSSGRCWYSSNNKHLLLILISNASRHTSRIVSCSRHQSCSHGYARRRLPCSITSSYSVSNRPSQSSSANENGPTGQ